MSLSQGLDSPISVARVLNQLSNLTESVSTASCLGSGESDTCRNEPAALRLKLFAIAAILFSGIVGIGTPLVGRKFRHLDSRNGGAGFILAKAFAAGVILATGFVHMLDDAQESLTNECLPDVPWQRFPFTGFIAMLAALGTLVLDFLATQFYEKKQLRATEASTSSKASSSTSSAHKAVADEIITIDEDRGGIQENNPKNMHIIGMHVHAAAHKRDHGDEQMHGHDKKLAGHKHEVELSSHGRHVVVAQAQFNNFSASIMATFFSITTPSGIGIGIAIASFYNADSPTALILEGILDSISAGILIYMALVDLIAADFLSRKVNYNKSLQVASYVALFLGALSMAALAIWA
ncbi:zinc transporter isoform X3 [Carex rostrata]